MLCRGIVPLLAIYTEWRETVNRKYYRGWFALPRCQKMSILAPMKTSSWSIYDYEPDPEEGEQPLPPLPAPFDHLAKPEPKVIDKEAFFKRPNRMGSGVRRRMRYKSWRK